MAGITDSLIRYMAERPDQTAIFTGETGISYEQLGDRVLRLARGLTSHLGLQQGDLAVLLLPNGLPFLEVFFSCALNGIGVAPIHPLTRNGELADFLDLLKPKRVFGHGPGPEGFQHNWLDVDSSGYASLFSDLPLGRAKPREEGDFFYGLTSGSTGRPKAVVRTQQSWVGSFDSVLRKLEMDEPVEMLVPGPLSYSASLVAALLTFHAGGTLRLLPGFNPFKVNESIEHATAAFMVPTMYRALLERGFEQRLKERSQPLTLISAGEKLNREAIAALTGWSPWVRLFEYYGAAELSFVSLCEHGKLNARAGSVGMPFEEVEVSIRDESGNSLPPACSGEIWVKSPWLARGYLITKEDSAEGGAKRADPTRCGSEAFSTEGSGGSENFVNGWASCGDVGYLDEAGYLYVSGRGENYVISGGLKVYCGEIELTLQQHPWIKQAVAMGLPDRNRNQIIGVALETRFSPEQAEKEIRLFCGQVMAAHKRPRLFLVLNELPRNASGKIDRNQIREWMFSNGLRNM